MCWRFNSLVNLIYVQGFVTHLPACKLTLNIDCTWHFSAFALCTNYQYTYSFNPSQPIMMIVCEPLIRCTLQFVLSVFFLYVIQVWKVECSPKANWTSHMKISATCRCFYILFYKYDPFNVSCNSLMHIIITYVVSEFVTSGSLPSLVGLVMFGSSTGYSLH